MVLKKIVSGAQTGADIAGIDAAIANDFPYGGWLPKGRKTEEGPLHNKYQMLEMKSSGYPKRTEQNIIDSDGTVIFMRGELSGGSGLTKKLAMKHGKPWLHLTMQDHTILPSVRSLVIWVADHGIEVLNVAGRCASRDPDIYGLAYQTIFALIRSTKLLVSEDHKESAYHSSISDLLKAAYQREIDQQECGRCKSKFPTLNDWYETLNDQQQERVNALLVADSLSSRLDEVIPK